MSGRRTSGSSRPSLGGHVFAVFSRRNKSIYLHRSGPLPENGLDRPKNRYGRYGFPSFYSIFISTVGVDEARVFLWRFSFLALWVVVVDMSQFPVFLHFPGKFAVQKMSGRTPGGPRHPSSRHPRACNNNSICGSDMGLPLGPGLLNCLWYGTLVLRQRVLLEELLDLISCLLCTMAWEALLDKAVKDLWVGAFDLIWSENPWASCRHALWRLLSVERGHYERSLFTEEISRISKISRFSRKWSDSPLFSTLWGLSRISKISKFSRISRKSTFLKRPPLFPNPMKIVSVATRAGLSGLPNANAKSQRFSYAISQIAPLPPVVELNRSFKSQIAARYARWAKSPIASVQRTLGEGPPAEPRHEVFPWRFANFAVQSHGNSGLKFLLKFFVALNVPAKQALKLRQKLPPKLRRKLRPKPPPSKMQTLPKTSLCRNPLLSERSQLSQAIPRFHAERMLHKWTPIARFQSQYNERKAYDDQFLCFGGRYERQRALVIRIAAVTLASDSAITIARFRPSKLAVKNSLFFAILGGWKTFRNVPTHF